MLACCAVLAGLAACLLRLLGCLLAVLALIKEEKLCVLAACLLPCLLGCLLGCLLACCVAACLLSHLLVLNAVFTCSKHSMHRQLSEWHCSAECTLGGSGHCV